MKRFSLLFLLSCLAGFAAPEEIALSSGKRKEFFQLLRPEVAKQGQLRLEGVKFEGALKQDGNWVFFSGRSLDKNSQSLELGPLGNDDTCALFLKTYQGWVMVAWSAGHSDLFYAEWAKSYGVPAELLGL